MVVFDCLDFRGQNIQAVDLRSQRTRNGCHPLQLFFLDAPGNFCRILVFYQMNVWVPVKKLTALQQGHGMGIHFLYILYHLTFQSHQIVMDGQVILPGDGQTGFINQSVIGKNRSRNGIFNRHHRHVRFPVQNQAWHFSKCHAFQKGIVLPKIIFGNNVVVRSSYSLNGYFHFLFFFTQKKSRFLETFLVVFFCFI
jgi:hypothetical protein